MPRRDPKPVQKWVTRYIDGGGRQCRKGTPGARKVCERTDTYYYRAPGRRGEARPYVSLDTTDFAQAIINLRDILRREREVEAGITTPLIEQAGRPLAEHVEAWLEAVGDGRAADDRKGLLRKRVTELARLARWRRAGDITAPSCLKALAELERTPGPGSAAKGRGVQTRNHYLSHAKQLTRWLATPSVGRLAADPLAGLKPVSVEGHERHRRRCPSSEEIRLLFGWLHAAGCPGRNGMTGPHRALMYEVTMCSGYRAGEVRGLTRAHFGPAWETVRLAAAGAGADKARRRRAPMPLPSWLSEKLAAWEAAGGALFAAASEKNAGRFLKADLGLARKAWVASAQKPAERAAREASPTLRNRVDGLDGPEFFDFHSLRHWYITRIGEVAGIDPLTLQTLSRHSDPRLTLERYGHARGDRARRAVEGLPRPGAVE